jgi:putative oxidoreductase
VCAKVTPYATLILRLSLGLPAVMAYVTFFLEVIVGIALITGFQTRLASLIGIPILAGTIVFVHGGAGWMFFNLGGG